MVPPMPASRAKPTAGDLPTGLALFGLSGRIALITGSGTGIGIAPYTASKGAAIFLSSDAAAFVDGHVLCVDGGVTTRP